MRYSSLDIEQEERFRDHNASLDGSTNTPKTSALSCFLGLLNTVMGGGLLGLPYAFSKAGWGLGSVLMCLCCLFSYVSLCENAYSARVTGLPASYYSVSQVIMPKVSFLIDFAVAVKCFGVATSYLVIFTDLMPEVSNLLFPNSDSIFLHRHVWCWICFAIVTPIAFLNSFDKLKYTSAAAIGFVFYLTLVALSFVIANSIYSPDELLGSPLNACGDEVKVSTAVVASTTSTFLSRLLGITHQHRAHEQQQLIDCLGDRIFWSTDMVDVLRVFPILVFSFTCQQNAFMVVNELVNPTKIRVERVYGCVMLVSLITYLVFCGCTFHLYGDNVNSDSLKSFPNTGFVTIGRLFISLLVICTYPLQSTPCRRSLLTLVRVIWNNGSEFSSRVETNLYLVITCCILMGSFILTYNLNDLGLLFSLVGASGSTIVSYILPGFFYYYSTRETAKVNVTDTVFSPVSEQDTESSEDTPSVSNTSSEEPMQGQFWRYFALFKVVFGTCLIPICVFSIVLKYIS